MVFGVTDQLRLEGVSNPEILEQDLLAICRERIVPPVWPRIDKVAFDSGLRVVVLEVGAKRAPHRTADGHYYVRVGAFNVGFIAGGTASAATGCGRQDRSQGKLAEISAARR